MLTLRTEDMVSMVVGRGGREVQGHQRWKLQVMIWLSEFTDIPAISTRNTYSHGPEPTPQISPGLAPLFFYFTK